MQAKRFIQLYSLTAISLAILTGIEKSLKDKVELYVCKKRFSR